MFVAAETIIPKVAGCSVPTIPNGSIRSGNGAGSVHAPQDVLTLANGYVYYACNEGYARRGTSHFNRCDDNHEWENEHSTCAIARCKHCLCLYLVVQCAFRV